MRLGERHIGAPAAHSSINRPILVHSSSYHYRALGLDIASSFPLPGFCPAQGSATGRNVTMQLGAAPQELDDPVCVRPLVQIDRAGTALFHVPGVARYLISDRSRIVIDVADGAPMGRATDFLIGAPLAILCLQNGLIPLASACVAIEGRAVLLGGPVGGCKSVMALALARKGHKFMADSLCALDISNPATGPLVWPELPQARIWPEALAALELPEPAAPPTPGGRRIVATDPWFEPNPLPAASLAILKAPKEGLAEPVVYRRGAAKFEAVMNLCFNAEIAKALPGVAAPMAAMALLANRLAVFDFRPELGLSRLAEEADRLLQAREPKPDF